MQEYKRDTDSKHRIDLPSKIHTCFWRKHDGYPNESINFDIITEFINNKTKMKLRVTDKSGFVCDEKDVEISNNKYCGSYRIPHEAEDSIKLEVEIEEYGLKGETKDLLVIKDVSLNIVNNEPKAENNPYSASAYRIKTDTGDTRIGKIKGNKVFAEKVHYIQEYSLEILTDEELKEITQYTNYVKQYFDTVDINISSAIKKIDEIKLGETGTATSATTTAETPTATDSQNTTASNTATETAANNTTSKTETANANTNANVAPAPVVAKTQEKTEPEKEDDDEPKIEAPWMKTAMNEIGQKEIPGAEKANPRIMEYFKAARGKWFKDDSEKGCAWCAAFISWVMRQHGYSPPNAAWAALSWMNFGKPVSKPTYGAIGVKSRGNGLGHVALVVGQSQDGKSLYMLGGNQGDKVCITPYKREDWLKFVVPSDYDAKNDILPIYDGEASTSSKED